jgi:hypothetical protein
MKDGKRKGMGESLKDNVELVRCASTNMYRVPCRLIPTPAFRKSEGRRGEFLLQHVIALKFGSLYWRVLEKGFCKVIYLNKE